ncbi:sodium:solute symporter [Rubrivirga marina]|uniref:Sodium transporter n=1 Tax=Rubrivirga marina TaxID=1196024 RepID=A0A271IV11_9BACT|nr:sodium:solute symporter [Rubrivirga marina]PAP74950.1 sodium transporter [Rubrivirga marina]
MDSLLGSLDWTVVALYFAVVFGVAIAATLRERRSGGGEDSADYFLAGRNVGWFVIGASLFSSNIGSEHLVGLAGSGATSGVAPGQFEVLASIILLLLGWVFVPFYLKSGVFTMPEFLERRYSAGARWYLATISILAYVLTKISVTIFAGAVVFSAIGVPFWTGALIVVGVTGAYTVFGGLRAVLYTDLLQTFVLIGGAVAVTVAGLGAVGGWGAMTEAVGPGFLDMWKPMSDPDFPWTGILFGAPILGIWYWCTDQFIVQRTLSAKTIDDARRGTIMAGFLKLLPLFIFVLPGMLAAALVAQGKLELGDPNEALPTLVAALLPIGLRGLVVAGLLAALMSSLSSVFNSCSTLITWDVYKKLNPGASERQLVWVGRLSTIALTVLGLAWIPFVEAAEGGLYVYIQSVQGYISPPIASVFLLGLFWSRLNAQGAIASLLTGLVLGVARLSMEASGVDAGLFTGMNFLHFAIALFLVCSAVLVAVSLMTAPPPADKIDGLTFGTASRPLSGPAQIAVPEKVLASDPAWRRVDVILTAVLLLCVAAVWIVFS